MDTGPKLSKSEIKTFVGIIAGFCVIIGCTGIITENELLILFIIPGALLFLYSFNIPKEQENNLVKKEKELDNELNEVRRNAKSSFKILEKSWKSVSFKKCSRCNDNLVTPIRVNSEGTSAEFECGTCGKKTWYNVKSIFGDELLVKSWYTVLEWNASYTNEQFFLTFKFKEDASSEGDESSDDDKGKKRRKSIPQDVKDKVWNRDGGKCVECDSKEGLEFDHIIPISKGGANTYRNLQLLCESCNRKKSDKIG